MKFSKRAKKYTWVETGKECVIFKCFSGLVCLFQSSDFREFPRDIMLQKCWWNIHHHHNNKHPGRFDPSDKWEAWVIFW